MNAEEEAPAHEMNEEVQANAMNALISYETLVDKGELL